MKPLYLIMFFEDFPEPCEVEVLVVLEENEAEVKLAEGQLQVVVFPGVGYSLLLFVLEQSVHSILSAMTKSPQGGRFG